MGRPRLLAAFEGGVPVTVPGGCFTMREGVRCVTVFHDGALKAVTGTEGSVTTIAAMVSAPECVIWIDDGLIVMPPEGVPRRFVCDGGVWRETELFPKLPPLMIVRHDTGTATAAVAVSTLHTAYTTTSQHLSDSDRESVDKAMREAYIRLSDSALLRGHYIQPVVARYRLIGEEGRVLYTSAPVIVAPANGMQGVTATLRLTGQGFMTCGATQLSAIEFVPAIEHVSAPDATWRALVRSVELQVSPQLHPYSATLPGDSSKSGASATELTMTVSLPGVDPHRDTAAQGTRVAACVAAIIDNADSVLQPMSPASDTQSELRRLREIASMRGGGVTADTSLAVSLAAPHTFTASAVARSGDLVAWGNLTVKPFEGYSLPEMSIAAAASQGSVPTAVKVTMHDGSTVVRMAMLAGHASPQLSPLLTYPSADAVEMTLLAGDKALTVPLTPTPCGRAAYYLNPALKPLTLDEERGGFVVPSASPRIRHYPSAVAVCPVDNPLAAIAVSHGDGTDISAVLAAPRHSNSFTVPSARFYLFGSGGISSMTLADNRRRVNLNLLDSRGVEGPHAVTPTDSGVAAIAGGALVSVTGTRPRTLLAHCRAKALGWSGRYGELWCTGAPAADTGDEALITSADGDVIYTRDGIGIAGCVSTGTGMMIVTTAGELLDTSEEVDAVTCIKHVSSEAHRFEPGSRVTVVSEIYGEDVSGEVTIGVSHGAPERAGACLRRLSIAGGDLNHPLCETVIVPHSHRMSLDVSLTTPWPKELRI